MKYAVHQYRNAYSPLSFQRYIDQAREIVLKNELSWDIPFDSKGAVSSGEGWDLRKFVQNNERHAANVTSFAINHVLRESAREIGWPEFLLPQGEVLDEATRDFLKAIAVHRATEGILPRSVREQLSRLRDFFSVTNKRPWELSSEDLNRYLELQPNNVKVSRSITVLANIVNTNLLSPHIPLTHKKEKETGIHLSTMLDEKKNASKLPEFDSLHELIRIVFQERPIGHHDKIRFGISRLLVLTGLRLNEVMMLPADCLQWENHFDSVTKKPVGEVGGFSRSLKLKYFGEKRQKKGAKVLVPDFQWVPEQFQELVASTVEEILSATKQLRDELIARHSSARTFRTSEGEQLEVGDFLFLVIYNRRGELPEVIDPAMEIEIAAPSSFFAFLGTEKKSGKPTIFTKYSTLPNKSNLFVRSHSLRHLMNTELFRQGVPDTVITQHFGRQSVAQSYVYDHRSLAERLKNVEVPASAIELIKPGTPQEMVAKMVLSDLFGGSAVAATFKKIQSESGDDAAFLYLAQNSDGFHVTPYGFCITSFAMNPCVRHLKCFDNCRHYVPSGMREHRISLESVRANLRVMKETAAAKPLTSVGRKNQIAHAERLISGIDLALASQPNIPLFINGKDYSTPAKDLFK